MLEMIPFSSKVRYLEGSPIQKCSMKTKVIIWAVPVISPALIMVLRLRASCTSILEIIELMRKNMITCIGYAERGATAMAQDNDISSDTSRLPKSKVDSMDAVEKGM
jgi:hypothetical protein